MPDVALSAQGRSQRVSENSLGTTGPANWVVWFSETGNQHNQKPMWEESRPEAEAASAGSDHQVQRRRLMPLMKALCR